MRDLTILISAGDRPGMLNGFSVTPLEPFLLPNPRLGPGVGKPPVDICPGPDQAIGSTGSRSGCGKIINIHQHVQKIFMNPCDDTRGVHF